MGYHPIRCNLTVCYGQRPFLNSTQIHPNRRYMNDHEWALPFKMSGADFWGWFGKLFLGSQSCKFQFAIFYSPMKSSNLAHVQIPNVAASFDLDTGLFTFQSFMRDSWSRTYYVAASFFRTPPKKPRCGSKSLARPAVASGAVGKFLDDWQLATPNLYFLNLKITIYIYIYICILYYNILHVYI